MREWWIIPNLLSLSRIPLAVAIGYCLWRDSLTATVVAAALIILAGVTDALDGFMARRMGRVTTLGIALDPISDKLFAIILVAALIAYRGFPVWLAVAVVGRDLLILIGGLLLSRREKVSLPSNLPGKYAFAALAVLLGAYVIRFQFSIHLMTPIVVTLLAWSLASYGRLFWLKWHGRTAPESQDRRAFAVTRICLIWVIAIAHFAMFYLEKFR